VRMLGESTCHILIVSLMTLSVFYSGLQVIISKNTDFILMQVIIMAMALTLILIYYRKSFFKPAERYRILGDAIFFYPMIFLI